MNGNIYRCYDAAGRVLYIGYVRAWGRTLEQRLSEHRRKSSWWSDVAHIDSINGNANTERKQIHLLRPLHNRQHNPDWVWTGRKYVYAEDPAESAA